MHKRLGPVAQLKVAVAEHEAEVAELLAAPAAPPPVDVDVDADAGRPAAGAAEAGQPAGFAETDARSSFSKFESALEAKQRLEKAGSPPPPPPPPSSFSVHLHLSMGDQPQVDAAVPRALPLLSQCSRPDSADVGTSSRRSEWKMGRKAVRWLWGRG